MDNFEIFTNLEAETAVLGTIIMNNDFLRKVEDILESKHFANEFHAKLYVHIVKMTVERPATQITLKEFFVLIINRTILQIY